MQAKTVSKTTRYEIIDWLKAWAIVAVVLDHLKVIPEPYVVWSVNIFVLVTAAMFSKPGYSFSAPKLFSKLIYLAFLYVTAVLCMDLIYTVSNKVYNRGFISVIFNSRYPLADFIRNPYLGDIWYLVLHVQIVVFAYFYLKIQKNFKPWVVFLAAALLSATSFYATHFAIHRYNTILITSWFLYLAVGFYALIPFLRWMESKTSHRGIYTAASLGLLGLIYISSPEITWAFTNENRSTLWMLPFYAVLIFFLTELFYFLDKFPAARPFKNLMNVIGRHTLAIYLTHHAFAIALATLFPSPWLRCILVIYLGIQFGEATDPLFALLKRGVEKITGRGPETTLPAGIY